MSERPWISPNRYREAYDKLEEVLNVAMLRWDVDTLSWVKYTGTDASLLTAIDALLQESLLVSVVDEASATVTYVGKAVAGTATSASSWRIYKYTVSGTVTTTTMAGGSMALANVFDDRAILVYS